jgi:hypothetical protein
MKLSFRQLFEDEAAGVLVPIVQRDYAQGRETESEVRVGFLDALHKALVGPADGKSALDLDFVYGSREADGKFLPLDGQQRLTTLFLLHWYLALRDGRVDDFRSYAYRDGKARFTYEVRPSSEQFFHALAGAVVDLDAMLPPDPGRDNALSKTLRDQRWFFLSWQRDPTVQACLNMLDAIHQRFRDPPGLYARLTDRAQPPITFQFLDLDDFGLGDELYIKMNARGKALTWFEAFKAQLERHIASALPDRPREHNGVMLALRNYVGLRFDTAWCDLIWNLKVADCPFDVRMRNAVRAVALAVYPCEGKGDRIAEIEEALDKLTKDELGSFNAYKHSGCLTEDFVDALIELLDQWAGEDGALRTFLVRTDYYDERAMFLRLLRGQVKGEGSVTYTDWVRFAAYCAWLRSGRPAQGLHEWMRVVSNLALNTPIVNIEGLRTSMVGVRQLLAAMDDSILEHLASASNPVPGFARQAVREERLKAQLLLANAAWRPLIERAETHPYFTGQIEFLFSFCSLLDRWSPEQGADWSSDEDEAFRAEFAAWLTKAEAVFNAPRTGGLRQDLPDFVWERALLCHGDYLLTKGSNHSLLVDSDRDVAWKRLLRADIADAGRAQKRDIVRTVLERVDANAVEPSLRAIIASGVQTDTAGTETWRRRLVEYPQMLSYCRNRWVRRSWDGAFYLLRGVHRAGHRELFTWHLALTLAPAVEAGEFAPFDAIVAPEVWGLAAHPHALLTATDRPELTRYVTFDGGQFHVAPSLPSLPRAEGGEPAQAEPPFSAAPEAIEEALRSLCGRLR